MHLAVEKIQMQPFEWASVEHRLSVHPVEHYCLFTKRKISNSSLPETLSLHLDSQGDWDFDILNEPVVVLSVRGEGTEVGPRSQAGGIFPVSRAYLKNLRILGIS